MDDGANKPAAPSRLWRIVLVVSLALNLAVVGLVTGAAVSGRLGDGPPRSFDFGLGPVARALSPQERRSIGIALRREGGMRNLNLRDRADNMITVLRSEPFDRDALQELMRGQSDAMAQLQTRAQTALLDQISQMSPERRADFADSLQDELSKARPPRLRGSGG